ncbi:MAG: peptidylprolyl isomerase [Chloroflexi bacterium]|nr:MAG: peptidylprolyl isomerase [Chloroflexota bacterium]
MTNEQVANNMVVGLAYTLKVDGEVVEQVGKDEPMEYLHGADDIIPGLEKQLAGKKVGDTFSVTIPPEDGYGLYDPEDVEELPRHIIDGADNLEKGAMLEIEDEDGDFYLAFVRDIQGDTITIDYNPPLAGKELAYDVEVVSIREATAEEIDHGHVHAHGLDDYDDEDDEDYDDDDDD